jgi:lipase chaperone LimK
MSQYTIEMNYDFLKDIPNINSNVVKSTMQSLMQNVVEEMTRYGWVAHKNDNEDTLRIRFWLNENAIKSIADEEIKKHKPKFRGLFLGFAEAVFGVEGKKRFSQLEKEVVVEQIKEQFFTNIEKQLLQFKGMPGVTIMKGNKDLFEQIPEQKQNKKIKIN